MREKITFVILTLILSMQCHAQDYSFIETAHHGFKIISQRNNKINISHQIQSIKIHDKKILLNNLNICNDTTPALPSNSHYVLIPNDANPKIELISFKKKTIEDIDLIYDDNNHFDLSELYEISDTINIRGFNFVILNITPFHYDKKRLDVFYDINIEISYDTRNATYGENRYRSREWDEIVRSMALNYEAVSDFDYDGRLRKIVDDNLEGCQYLIVTPNDNGIRQWADTLSRFRNEQGILTKVVCLSDICNNSPFDLKDYFNDIYRNWDMVPSAIMLFGDYSQDATKGICSFYLNDHPEKMSYLADNRFVDFDNDNLPEMIISRLPAENAQQAELMVKKTIRYERNPSDNPYYYETPVTAAGYEESRWFQLSSETIAGFFETIGKEPKRLNAVNYGSPDSLWSSAENTDVIVDYFGPDGLQYIPSDMRHLTEWNADNEDICDAVNRGSFLVQYRGHGKYQAWSKPYLSNSDINNLNNEDLTFVMSTSCRTGNFLYGEGNDDCLAERFMRVEKGCVAIIAASELSFSFVNDIYVWGCYDYLWNDFLPSLGDNKHHFKYPAFANAYGKFLLRQSSLPGIEADKNITYNLFHYFGDAYLKLNTELPKEINISYPKEIFNEQTSITIKKDEDTDVAFSVDGKIIATAKGSDSVVHINPQRSGTLIKVVATKQDYYRHEGYIFVKSKLDKDDVFVYPNPAKDYVNVESRGILRIDIYNNIGQKVAEIDNSDLMLEKIEIDCRRLKKGLFHLHIIYEDKRVGKSFVVI